MTDQSVNGLVYKRRGHSKVGHTEWKELAAAYRLNIEVESV